MDNNLNREIAEVRDYVLESINPEYLKDVRENPKYQEIVEDLKKYPSEKLFAEIKRIHESLETGEGDETECEMKLIAFADAISDMEIDNVLIDNMLIL